MLVHLAAAAVVIALATHPRATTASAAEDARSKTPAVDVRRIVFIPRGQWPAAGGGGGGGNRQRGPIRRAEAVGTDAMTLRVARPVSTTGQVPDAAPLPGLVLDAKPLASGTVDQVGLPAGGVSFGTSTGTGSGGGVGDGTGTGIGSGRGPGIGDGSGGGIGGGVYRTGGGVTSPRVITEVTPAYTDEALLRRIQGTVVLELIVRANGRPSDIRVLRSLDPGLDQQALAAASQWRFAPGRLAGAPVDVVVTIMMGFWIR